MKSDPVCCANIGEICACILLFLDSSILIPSMVNIDRYNP